jgi:adenylate kinase
MRAPNILITGTPGAGKTSLASQIAEMTGMNLINIGDLVKEKGLHDGWDEEFQCYTLNEDKLCDELEPILGAETGGNIVDFHTASFFPVRWFHLVLVLRASTSTLYTRLEKRGYAQNKIDENMEAEILQVCLDEARDGWNEEQVVELQSDTLDDMESNAQRCVQWIEHWKQQHAA